MGRLGGSSHWVNPVPGLPRDDRVELSAGGLPGFKCRHLDLEPVPPRDICHPRVDLDPEHAAAGSLELAGGDPGPTADVEDVWPWAGSYDPLHHRLGIARPGSVVALGVRAERLGNLSLLMWLESGYWRSLRPYSGHPPTILGKRPLAERGGTGQAGRKCAVPTGVAIRDAREQLFDAAERVLLRDGPNALTSRSVTTEAGFAKGVLHRHFADFDALLADLVLDRIAQIDHQAAALCNSAGTGTVADNLSGTLMALFGSVAVAIVALIISRDGLRARLRQTGSAGVPVLAEATAMIASYLTIERELGRVAADADVEMLAHLLIGTGHLLFADREGVPPEAAALERVVTMVIDGLVQEALL